jgi:uncharacterized delta-60 repeat protein
LKSIGIHLVRHFYFILTQMRYPVSLVLLLSLGHCVWAQTAGIDSTFGASGKVITPAPNSSEINAIAVQPDGKIAAAGYWDSLGTYHFQTARYHSNGLPDNSFGNGGIVFTSIGNSAMPYSVAVQADGKIVAAGCQRFTNTPPFQYHSVIVRYDVNGTLDNSFGSGGVVTTIVSPSEDGIASIALQADGKIVAGGWAGTQFLVMRYNSDGTMDNSFGTGGKTLTAIASQSSVYSIALQSDGKIVACGTAGDPSNYKFALARYNTNGTLDNTFGTAGIVTTDFDPVFYDVGTSMTIQADGKIIAAGYSGYHLALARYTANGILDPGFSNSGMFASTNYPSATGIGVQSNGKIVVSGNLNNSFDYEWAITRFDPNGVPDTSFGNIGTISINIKPGNDYAQCLAIQPDDKVVVAGSSRDSSTVPASFTLVRFTTGVTGIAASESVPDAHIYPNPFTGSLTVSLPSIILANEKEITFVLYDMQGREVNRYKIEKAHSVIMTGNLPDGIYFYRLYDQERQMSSRMLIKQ